MNEEFGSGQNRVCDGRCFRRGVRQDYVLRMEEVGGLQLPDFVQQVLVPDLPPIILGSVLDSPSSQYLLEHEDFICVKYEKISPIRRGDTDAAAEWRRAKGIPDRMGLLVGSEMSDHRLAAHFRASLKRKFFEACSLITGAVYSSLAFSIYNDGTQCRWWQPYNLARSYRSAYILNALGLPCIVAIGADNHRDEERIAERAARQGPKLSHFAVNCQTNERYSSRPNFDFARRIEQLSRQNYHWVFFGVSDEANMVAAYEALNRDDRITFVTSKPVMRGIHGSGLRSQKPLPFPIPRCIELNIEELRECRVSAVRRFEIARSA